MKRFAACLLVLLIGAAVPAFAAESATTVRAVELKQAPAPDAESLGQLPAQTPVDILQRQGGWSLVKSGDQRGWVRLLSLKLNAQGGAQVSEESGGFLASLFGFGRRNAASGASATTGIRGLSEEELKNANPNPGEVAKLDHYQASQREARSYAQQHHLQSREVAFVEPEESAP